MPPQWRGDTRVEGQLVGPLDPGRAPNGKGTQEGGLARVEGRMSPGSVGPGTSQMLGSVTRWVPGSIHRRVLGSRLAGLRAPNSVTR